MNTPTAASLLIDALTPAQRAILHTALRMYQAELKDSLTETMADTAPVKTTLRIAQALQYCNRQAKHLTNSLFAECLLDDLDVVPYAAAHIKEQEQIFS